MLATEDFKNFKPISINKRIETDELLGPLPDNWEMSKYGKYNRCFFVDHDSKTTTWVDPRTYHLRKHDVNLVVDGELPFGWEETFDENCGRYFIDHITQRHFFNGPWEDVVKKEVSTLHASLKTQADQLKASLEKEQAKKAELEKAEALLKVLETEKVRIESEIKNLKAKGGSADKQNLASLQTELKSVLARVDNEKNLADKIKTDHKKLIGEISDFQTKVLELREVNERLENDNKQLANESKQQADAIAEMKQMIEMEATQRNALDAYIKQLKNDVLGLYVPNEEGEGNEPMGASDVQEKGTVEK